MINFLAGIPGGENNRILKEKKGFLPLRKKGLRVSLRNTIEKVPPAAGPFRIILAKRFFDFFSSR
jgi:hypothetical protein